MLHVELYNSLTNCWCECDECRSESDAEHGNDEESGDKASVVEASVGKALSVDE